MCENIVQVGMSMVQEVRVGSVLLFDQNEHLVLSAEEGDSK